ncbi:MAG: CHASE3 domain-containing protein [Polyangiales bacterium]
MVALRHRRAAWLIALGAVLAAALVSHVNTVRYIDNVAAVQHTMAVRAALADTLSLLKDAETGQRGYLLTGDEQFLTPYNRVEHEIAGQLTTLRNITEVDPDQRASARELERLARAKLTSLRETIVLRRAGDADAALAIVRAGHGHRLMEAVRGVGERMTERENARLAARVKTAEKGEHNALLTLGAVLALAVSVVVVGLASVRRDLAEARRMRDQLVASERAFRNLADNASDLIQILEPDDTLGYSSPSSNALLGYSAAELKQLSSIQLLHESDRPSAAALLEQVRATGRPAPPVVHRIRCKHGDYRWFETRVQPAIAEGGVAGRLHLSSRDVTERKLAEDARARAEHDLVESERRWRALSEASFEGVAIARQGKLLDVNATLASWLGRSTEALVGSDALAVFVPQDRDYVARASARDESFYEARMLRADGGTFPVEVRARSEVFDGGPVRVAVIRDVAEKKQREADLRAQAELLRALSLRDELTKLYNRRGFLELALQQLRIAARGKQTACVFFADLNGMKSINDGLGHEIGDRAISATARILGGVFRESDVVARLGGDEFAMFAADCDVAGAEALRLRLQAAVEEHNEQTSERFRLSISVGFGVYDPEHPKTLEALMEEADSKMYIQKRSGAPRTSLVQKKEAPADATSPRQAGRR